MKILYLGNNYGTSCHRYQALKRLGHDVLLVDPDSFLPSNRLMEKWVFETGALGFSAWVWRGILSKVHNMYFDLVWVDHGQLLSPKLVKTLRNKFGCTVNYFHDNLLYKRNYRKWRLYRASIPEYNVLVVVQKDFIDYAKALGAKKVVRVFRSADELLFRPLPISIKERMFWSSEVCFVGTWIPGRGSFIAELLKRDVPISIWGDRWKKAKKWRSIKNAWRGPGVHNKDYVMILESSKICLGLLSGGDQHTTRSIEIPAVGGLLCAERTKEHLAMYKDGEEAAFWDDVEECARVCHELLEAPERRREIARRGYERCLRNNFFHEPVLRCVIRQAMAK